MNRVLVIAIGNPLRSDDGLAWHAADELSRVPDAPQVLRVHQLTPELAEGVSRADTVIFVDATSEGTAGTITCQCVGAATTAQFSHHLTPAAVLALAETLYAAQPSAFLVAMTGEYFDHGDALSVAVIGAMPQLLAKIRTLIAQASVRS
jgi:hydrogenase maturation protease